MSRPARSMPPPPDASTLPALLAKTAEQLAAMLDAHACWYEPFPFDAQLPRIESVGIVLPAAEPGIEPWSFGAGVELPVRFAGLTLGRFVVLPAVPTTGVAFSPSARAEAIAAAARVGVLVAEALVDTAHRR